ncbi:hypothetical protein [Halorubrum trueperi]|uniref:DUF2178 domain-containing protein n=1 Tax=Halorubrum trueperi TaxID=2004704 RepID=A0ABD5UL93_9EURY
MKQLVTQCFRGYCALAVIVSGFTALWALGVISVAVPVVGYAWFAVAAAGTVVAAGMFVQRDEAIVADATEERVDRFERAAFTGTPLNLYIGALAAWASVSFGWVLGGMSADGIAVLGYGWLAIAAYGAVVGIGIAAAHGEDVATAVSPSERLETDS